MRRFSMLLIATVLCGGCYHVTVLTGATPGTTTVEKEWQHAFILGIVPPAEINANPPCTQGVAKVETERSFLNGLVGVITYNIYTPIHVTITCAGR